MGSDGVPRRPRYPRFLAAGRGGWRVTVDTTTTDLDSTVTVDPGGWWSDHGRRSDTGGRQSDTGGRSDNGHCRLITGGNVDSVSRPPRTAGGQDT
jgi:hypothetical protein